MNIIINTKDDCCEKVKLDLSPAEWLIVNKALRQFVINEANAIVDTDIAKGMIIDFWKVVKTDRE